MKKKAIIIVSAFCLFTACYTQAQTIFQTFETPCDINNKNKSYKIVQQYFPNGVDTISNNNMIFQLFSNNEVIYQDTLYSFTGETEFRDFNGDNLEDILIQNISDARSNWTYYLYLVDTVNNSVKRIKGFEKIKNPNYLSQYNLIDNYVNSGENWTSFYKIQNDTIRDFNVVIYDNSTYDEEYKKAIDLITSDSIE
ncbi:hypothetical protein [Bacteroides sp. 519]|uniref:XAC2610-related protein n=1 Tax=Bacteroides sp. 519 TaxID=2302937 RepID=UPI0013CFC22B|nr:hypothetical protein [Bacteroides sp. 519]NDV59269.1 hypothetical protein [Bacteroides sp. 519]